MQYKPIHAELKKLKNGWTNKRDKYEEAHRAELTLWDAANRYLHAHLPEGVKTLPISAWEKEYTAIKAQREAEYDMLKETRAEVAELQKIRKIRGYCTPRRPAGADAEPHQAARTGAIKKRTGKLLCLSVLNVFR